MWTLLLETSNHSSQFPNGLASQLFWVNSTHCYSKENSFNVDRAFLNDTLLPLLKIYCFPFCGGSFFNMANIICPVSDLGTVHKVQRRQQKEIHCNGGRGVKRLVHTFCTCRATLIWEIDTDKYISFSLLLTDLQWFHHWNSWLG